MSNGTSPFTVLISSAGRRVSLLRTFREAFEAMGVPGRVIACDLSELTSAMRVADDRFTVPRCDDPEFGPTMVELCAAEGVDLVVPTIDTELPVWANLREPLARSGTAVAVSSRATIDVAADKSLTNAHCRSAGIYVARQATPSVVSEARSQWRLPLVVKPQRGSASIGLHIVHTWAEFDWVTRDEAGQDLVVEEFLPGVEHTVDLFVDRRGEVHCPVVRRRLEVRAGEVSKARVVRDDDLASLAAKVVETLPGAYGPLNVQIMADGPDAGIVEINARFGGGYPLTWRAGGRYSEWLIREVAFGEKPPAGRPVEHGLTMLRWDEEVLLRE
jgi:carbamoyl-phosphate synthase large subunit